MEGPIRGTVEDFDAVVELADTCFPGDRELGGMRARWPHCYVREPAAMNNYLLMKDGGRIVSMVSCWPQIVQVDGAEIRCAGISSVATHPDYRGRGLMSVLIRAWIDELTNDRVAFVELGGERRRYARFGWEPAGRLWRFRFNHRSLDTVPLAGDQEVFSLTPYAPADLDAVITLHDRSPFGLKRTRADHERLFSRLGRSTWTVRRHNTIEAYLSVSDGPNKTVGEFDGRIDALLTAFRTWLNDPACPEIVLLSPWNHPGNRDFFRHAAGWRITAPRHVKIIDLDTLLHGFTNQLARRWQALHIADTRQVSLGIADQDKKLTVTFSSNGVTVSAAQDKDPALVLPDIEMVRFLFSPAGPAAVMDLPPHLAFLNALFPLDYHIRPLEQV